jgi:hypothetical protein
MTVHESVSLLKEVESPKPRVEQLMSFDSRLLILDV